MSLLNSIRCSQAAEGKKGNMYESEFYGDEIVYRK